MRRPTPTRALDFWRASMGGSVVTFDVFDGPPHQATYDLSNLKYAGWTDTGDDLADLVVTLKSGETRRHKVVKMTAINVCERIEAC